MMRRGVAVATALLVVGSVSMLVGVPPSLAAGTSVGIGDVTVYDAAVPRLAKVPITLSAPQATDVTVTWTISGGTATTWVDYVPLSSSGTKTTVIPAGKTREYADVKIWATAGGEPIETVEVSIVAVTSGIEVTRSTGTIRIVSPGSSPAPGTVAVGDVAVVEGDSAGSAGTPLTIPITVFDPSPSPSDGPITITYELLAGTATAGADFQPFTSPRKVTVKTNAGGGAFSLSILPDTAQEHSKSFSVRIVSVTDPNNPTVVLKDTGTITIVDDDSSPARLWSCGMNASGQLGLGDTDPRPDPAQVGSATNWLQVAGGQNHSVGLRNDGTLWAWGRNTVGQLGQGTASGSNQTTPIQVGTAFDWRSITAGIDFSLALRADGTLWAWGDNSFGQLGLGDTIFRTSPQQVGTSTDWAAVAAGDSFVLARKTDGTLWAWGRNESGSLGLGDTTQRNTPTQVGTATNWAAISAGGFHSAALRSDGTLWTWGNNLSGQLGLGDTSPRTTPTQVGTATDWAAISAGGFHVLAIRQDGSLWVWGRNNFGQLGLGDTTNRTTPTQLGTQTDWDQVSTGGFTSLALKTDGTLWAWGANAALNPATCTGDDVIHNTPTQVGSSTWYAIEAGYAHNLLLSSP